MTLERATSAGLWGGIEIISKQLTNFVAIIFLARLLTPLEFGMFAFPVLLAAVFSALISGGFTTLIIQRQDLVPDDYDRIFSLVIFLSLLAGGCIIALGSAVVNLYDFDRLRSIFPIVSLQPLLAGISSVQFALLAKALKFRPMAVIGVVASAAAGALAIAVAMGGFGIWALVAQMITLTSLNAIGFWIVCDWRPRLNLDWRPLLPSLKFALPVSVTQALQIVYFQGAALIVAKRYSATEVGLLNRGIAVTQLFNLLFGGLVGRVALPLMSEVQGERTRMISGLRMGLRTVMVIAFPLLSGLAFLSHDILMVLYGDQWTAGASALSLLAIATLTVPIQAANANLLLARGASRTYFWLEIKKRIIGISCIVIGSFFGILGVAWAYFLSGIISVFLHSTATKRGYGYGFTHQLKEIHGFVVASIIMVIGIYAMDMILNLDPWPRIISTTLVGALIYGLTGWFLNLHAFRQSVGSLFLAMRRLARPML